jgi:hypothetical protein
MILVLVNGLAVICFLVTAVYFLLAVAERAAGWPHPVHAGKVGMMGLFAALIGGSTWCLNVMWPFAR